MRNNLLLSEKLRPFGLVLLLIGLFLVIMRYQFNYKPDFLNLKIFAFYSYYIESKSFAIVSNQLIEELGAILMLAGLFVMSFSKEGSEKEEYNSLRLRAFMLASYFNFIFLLMSLLFFFGFGFVGALTVFMGIWLLSYLVAFKILLYHFKKTEPIL
jgi:hypothetical protein